MQDISSPVHVCDVAIEAAAKTFGTTPEAVLSTACAQEVSDARAVAMTAARTNGLSLPKIAAEFGDRHRTVVLQATRRIEKTPPLRELAERIAKGIPKAEGPGNVGGVRRTAMPDEQVTTTPGRG